MIGCIEQRDIQKIKMKGEEINEEENIDICGEEESLTRFER